MSVIIPAHVAVDATRALAQSALPDAPVEPETVRTRPRLLGFLRAARPAIRATPAGHAPAGVRAEAEPACS